jgi:CO/xanthine dehydrogenase FAD-binding subunit
MTLLTPTSLEELSAALTTHDKAVVVGGAVGLMSAAMTPTWGTVNISLAGLGLDRRDGREVGAMVTLEALERGGLPGRRAVLDAVRQTATPALRRRITIGGVLASVPPGPDLSVALGAHEARVRVLECAGGQIAWHPLPRLPELAHPRVVLEVDLGPRGPSRFRRFSGHHRGGPSLVSVAARVRADGTLAVCVCSPPAPPRLLDGEHDSDDRLVRSLVADIARELGDG